jgi:hypothetical protein
MYSSMSAPSVPSTQATTATPGTAYIPSASDVMLVGSLFILPELLPLKAVPAAPAVVRTYSATRPITGPVIETIEANTISEYAVAREALRHSVRPMGLEESLGMKATWATISAVGMGIIYDFTSPIFEKIREIDKK